MIDKNIDTTILLGIYELNHILEKKNLEFVANENLTNQQWIILIHLAKDPNLPYLIREGHHKPLMASELADSLGVSRANITNLLNGLIEKRLIRQIEDEEDKRRKRLVLTNRGLKLISKMQEKRISDNSSMLKGLTISQKKQFLKLLQKATSNIKDS